MRALCIVLAIIGGCALIGAVAIELGPGPFYAVGLVLAFRGPGQRVGAWLLATGAMFLLNLCLGDAILPLVHGSSFAWIVALAGEWAGSACLVTAVGLIGLFPTGVPQRAAERWALWTTGPWPCWYLDQPSRRSMVYRALWLLIAVGYVAAVAALGLLAGQHLPVGATVLLVAAAALLHLTAELSDRLDVIRLQAAELTASRARVAQTRDTERQRIQRDLHDGVQQDLVALTAKLALARERLRRGDPRADESLAELQRDMGELIGQLRDFAHAIHPPVLADQGLLEAIEAQAARLPLEVVIEADPALRGVRYPPQVETATWYVVSEALTNAVKHAQARRVLVALARPDGQLAVEIRDDGCRFDQATVRSLGLASLADRIAIVDGALRIDSSPGQGTTLRAEVPLTTAGAGDG